MFLRKFLSIILCVSMLFCFTIPVAANDAPIEYGVNEKFVLIIPCGFYIGSSGKAVAVITVEDIILSHGNSLMVSISSKNYDGSWKLIDIQNDDNKVTYTIGSKEGENDISNNSEILYIDAGTHSEESKTIYFTISDKSIDSGYYNDVLTFIVDVN